MACRYRPYVYQGIMSFATLSSMDSCPGTEEEWLLRIAVSCVSRLHRRRRASIVATWQCGVKRRDRTRSEQGQQGPGRKTCVNSRLHGNLLRNRGLRALSYEGVWIGTCFLGSRLPGSGTLPLHSARRQDRPSPRSPAYDSVSKERQPNPSDSFADMLQQEKTAHTTALRQGAQRATRQSHLAFR